MIGYLDLVDDNVVQGWAADRADDGAVVEVSAWLDGRCIGRGRADRHRPDLDRPVGFRFALTRPADAGDFLGGRAWVEARGARGAVLRLPLGDVPGFVERVVAPHLAAIPGAALRAMVGRVLLARARNGRPLSDQAPAAVDPRSARVDATSAFSLPVGTLSPDAEVVVGHDGHLFLVTGSNGLVAQYDPRPPGCDLAERWAALVEHRAAEVEARGARFVQLVVPEKASVLADRLPFAIQAPTPLYAALAARLAGSEAFVELFEPLARAPDRDDLFLRLDSHMTARGTFRLLAAVLARLGLPAAEPVFSVRARSTEVDLARHFPWLGFVEEDRLPAPASLPADGLTCVVDERTHRHLGTRLVFRNPCAPLPQRVVAFGNSFFSRGECPQQLSWWFARWFAEFHFVWAGEVDLGYVDRVRPDVVVAQTVERFLPVAPGA